MPAIRDVIVDTDIGDDIDDAFALALVLRSPLLRLDAVVTSLGDTALRARLARHLLADAGRGDVPVHAGPATPPRSRFTQRDYALSQPPPVVGGPDALDAVLERLRRAPDHSITLLALAPMFTIGALIARDPVAFRRLGAVVMMGGSIARGYPFGPSLGRGPDAEYNVVCDPAGLRALLATGVPVEMMPLDATLVPLASTDRARLLAGQDGLHRALQQLYDQWFSLSPYPDHPTLFDVVPVAWLLRPTICGTMRPFDIQVDAAGFTRVAGGRTNASACLGTETTAVMSVLGSALADEPAAR